MSSEQKIELNPTLSGLEHWVDRVLTRLGYMALAIHKNSSTKLVAYDAELAELKQKLSDRKDVVQGLNEQTDLTNLLNKIIVLEKAWEKLKAPSKEEPLAGGAKKKGKSKSKSAKKQNKTKSGKPSKSVKKVQK